VGEDGYLEPQEEAELNALKEELGLGNEEIAPTCGQLVRLKRLTAIKNGQLPVLDADILLKKGELCHFEVSCDLVEERSRTRYVGASQGVSFRIAKGLYYRVGGFKGERVVDTYKQVTDSGTLYITNKRVVFTGTKKNVTYPLNKIVNFVKYRDAVQFQKENEARPKYFVLSKSRILSMKSG
jgi:GRAM domain.